MDIKNKIKALIHGNAIAQQALAPGESWSTFEFWKRDGSGKWICKETDEDLTEEDLTGEALTEQEFRLLQVNDVSSPAHIMWFPHQAEEASQLRILIRRDKPELAPTFTDEQFEIIANILR